MLQFTALFNKKILVITVLGALVFLGTAGTIPGTPNREFKNLKILPKDISHDALDKIMDDDFCKSLGVKCGYCHVKDTATGHLDFASDGNEKKEATRFMMNMSLQLNKESFLVAKPMIGDSVMVVTCYTCHHGEVYPDNKSKPAPMTDFIHKP